MDKCTTSTPGNLTKKDTTQKMKVWKIPPITPRKTNMFPGNQWLENDTPPQKRVWKMSVP